MSRTRTAAACLKSAERAMFDRAWNNPSPSVVPNFNLERQIAKARADMGEERWAELNKEWEA